MKRANDQVGFLIIVLIWLMSLLPLYGAPLKVGLVKDYARLNDRSFNQLTYQGLVQAEKELGIRGTAVVAKKNSDYLFNMQRYARGGYDLVIGVGVFMTEAIKDAAVQFPGTKFLLIDVPVEGFPNISSAIFASQEISFLAGALSALVNLGYPRTQAERVVEAASTDAGGGASIEALIRHALRRLVR